MIIKGADFSAGGNEVYLYDESGSKYALSVSDAKKTGTYKYAEDNSLLPAEEDDEMIVFLSRKLSCIRYASYLLEFSDKSKKTLVTKLRQKGYEKDVCDAAVATLEKNGIIDDDNLCRRKLEAMAREKYYGPYRLKGELIKKGFSSDVIENAIEDADIDFDELLEKLVQKLTRRANITDIKELNLLKNKLVRYGYGYESVKEAVEPYKNFDEE